MSTHPAGRLRVRDGDDLVAGDGRRVPVAEAVHLPPVEPSKIIATHLTCRSRVEEFMTRLPPAPTYFHKPTTSLNSHRGSVVRPGDAGSSITRARSPSSSAVPPATFPGPGDGLVAGFTIANDFGLHDFRATDAGSILRVKGSDTLCPVGPGVMMGWDFRDKDIRTLVNGEVRQEDTTSNMEWDIPHLGADLARTITPSRATPSCRGRRRGPGRWNRATS